MSPDANGRSSSWCSDEPSSLACDLRRPDYLLRGVLMVDAASWQKEQFSNAYVLAVATRAGFTLGDWKVDKDGVDVTLRRRALMVDLQLKCTRSPRITKAGFSFDLDKKTYDKLVDPERSAPAYLALIIVPPNVEQWLTHHPQSLALSCHGYFTRFTQEMRPAGGETVAVPIERRNVLNGDAMEDMFRVSRMLVFGR